MIVSLNGIIEEKQDQQIVINVGGVGYGVIVTDEFAGSLKLGEETKLFIYEHIREVSHDLFGFRGIADKKLFEKLLSVNGVGPKMAISIMNLGTADELSSAIGSANVAYITRANGVGRKLAERITVDLKDGFAESALMSRIENKEQNDALAALISLGYHQSQAVAALSEVDADTTEDQIKKALQVLSK